MIRVKGIQSSPSIFQNQIRMPNQSNVSCQLRLSVCLFTLSVSPQFFLCLGNAAIESHVSFWKESLASCSSLGYFDDLAIYDL